MRQLQSLYKWPVATGRTNTSAKMKCVLLGVPNVRIQWVYVYLWSYFQAKPAQISMHTQYRCPTICDQRACTNDLLNINWHRNNNGSEFINIPRDRSSMRMYIFNVCTPYFDSTADRANSAIEANFWMAFPTSSLSTNQNARLKLHASLRKKPYQMVFWMMTLLVVTSILNFDQACAPPCNV